MPKPRYARFEKASVLATHPGAGGRCHPGMDAGLRRESNLTGQGSAVRERMRAADHAKGYIFVCSMDVRTRGSTVICRLEERQRVRPYQSTSAFGTFRVLRPGPPQTSATRNTTLTSPS